MAVGEHSSSWGSQVAVGSSPYSSVSATARAAGDGDGGVRLTMVVPAGGVMFLVRGVIGDGGNETGGGRCRRWS
ncbi:hypothetical protein Dimus_000407, partial [Dionaea muscipula]